MSAVRRWAIAGCFATALAFSLAAWASGPSGTQRPAGRLLLSGVVKGLYPGAHAQLRVRLRNRMASGVRVVSVTARVSDAAPGCTRANLRVGRYRGHVFVPRRRSRAVILRVSMPRSAPDACRGAVFRIAFRARAVQA